MTRQTFFLPSVTRGPFSQPSILSADSINYSIVLTHSINYSVPVAQKLINTINDNVKKRRISYTVTVQSDKIYESAVVKSYCSPCDISVITFFFHVYKRLIFHACSNKSALFILFC